jgi:predicted RNase H-like HicB family nuclease
MKMNDQWLEKAKELAFQNYEFRLEQDVLSDGSPVFLASNPELPGCKSQGSTVEEAMVNLAQARIDYIYSLLEDGLDVPEPKAINTISGTSPDAVVTYIVQEFSMDSLNEDGFGLVIQSENHVPLYRASVKA